MFEVRVRYEAVDRLDEKGHDLMLEVLLEN